MKRNIRLWKILSLLILALISSFIYLVQYTNVFKTHHAEYKVSIVPTKKLLRNGDTTSVYVAIADSDKSRLKILWSSDYGRIIGNGDAVKYIAPNITGNVTIRAKIVDTKKNIFSVSTNILIYKQIIFLKADDMVFEFSTVVNNRWKSFIEYIKSKGIKASIGLIGNSLEKGNSAYYSYLKALNASGLFEIWNHGYNHKLNGINKRGEKYHEFWNTTYDFQIEHLLKTQNLAMLKLGIILHTFGAPGNAIDSTTTKALDDIDDIKVWYYGKTNSEKLMIESYATIEFPTHNPDYKKFVEHYNGHKRYLALQFHPKSWDSRRFSEFKNVIDFLINKDVTFMTPYEYYQYLN